MLETATDKLSRVGVGLRHKATAKRMPKGARNLASCVKFSLAFCMEG